VYDNNNMTVDSRHTEYGLDIEDKCRTVAMVFKITSHLAKLCHNNMLVMLNTK